MLFYFKERRKANQSDLKSLTGRVSSAEDKLSVLPGFELEIYRILVAKRVKEELPFLL